MRSNKLRELIRQGKGTLGTHVLCPWPGVAEVVGSTGEIDYVEFVGEYAPWDLHDLENIARACEAIGISSMIKIDQQPRTWIAQRALGSGIQNLLFADVRNAQDAEECVKAVHMETPEDKGLHGCHMRRSVGYVVDVGSKQYVKAMNDTVIAFMIEKKSAVDHLEEVLSVKGVDMVQFGPCDYSISIGAPGEFTSTKVREAELKTIKTAIKMDKRPRVELGWGFNEKNLQRYLDLGVKDFCNGTDVEIVHAWVKENMPKVRKAIAS